MKPLQCVCAFTYSGPVLPYKPQVVAEEGQNTDAEHGRHKKKEQDVEFGVSVRQLILGEDTGAEERGVNGKFTLEDSCGKKEKLEGEHEKGERRNKESNMNHITASTLGPKPRQR